MRRNPGGIRRLTGASFLIAVVLATTAATPITASSVINVEVSVGSPHNIAPRSHQNEPVVAMDAHNPNLLVSGSNDYID